jgi:hypothetical protein
MSCNDSPDFLHDVFYVLRGQAVAVDPLGQLGSIGSVEVFEGVGCVSGRGSLGTHVPIRPPETSIPMKIYRRVSIFSNA